MNEHTLKNQQQIWQSRVENEIKSLEDKVLTLSKFISTQVELKSDCDFPPEIRRIMQQIEQRENQKKEISYTKKSSPLVKSKSMNSHLCDKRLELNLPLRSVDENQEVVELYNNNNSTKSFCNSPYQKENEDNKSSKNINVNLKIEDKLSVDSDSGISTPQTPLDIKHGDKTEILQNESKINNLSHPLSNCDVSFTYNGTTKLKTIRPLRANLSRTISTDLLPQNNPC